MAGPALFRPSDISTGLQGYWKFNGDATDSSSNGYDLTGTSPAYAAGGYWNDGEDDAEFVTASSEYLSIADASCPNLEFNGASAVFTVSGWLKIDSAFPTGSGYVASKYTGPNGWFIDVNGTAPNFRVRMWDTGAYMTMASTFGRGQWIHFAVVYDKPNNLRQIYLNGNLDITTTATATLPDSNTDFVIGRNSGGSTYFGGKMKDMAVHNVALTPLQIKSLAMGVDLSSQAYRPDSVSTAPTGYYKLNEPSGNAIDSSGSGYTGTDVSSVGSTGGYTEGIARDFNSDYFSVTDTDDAFDPEGTYSVCAWVKFDSTIADDMVCGKWVSNTGWYFSITQSTTAGMRLYHNATNYQVEKASTVDFVQGTWYHVGAVYDDDADTVTYYLDGKVWAIYSGATVDPTANAQTLQIGARGDNADIMSGALQDVAFWKGYALTDDEIKNLASAFPIQQTGISSYWSLDEESGERADSIGSNNLTDTNSVLFTADGVVDNAARFDEANLEELVVGTDASIDANGYPFTVMAWARYSSSKNQGILCKGTASYASVGGYNMTFDSGNWIECYIDGLVIYAMQTPLINTWYHVCLTADGADNKAYGDGHLNDTNANLLGTGNADDLRIGMYRGSTYMLTGDVDEVMFAKRDFREEEVKSIYIKGLNDLALTSEFVTTTIGKIAGVSYASMKKVSGVAKASIKKLAGVE